MKREQKKAEKQAKFNQKKGTATSTAPTLSTNMEKKVKAEKDVLPLYIEDTPAGDKKSIWNLHLNHQLFFRFPDCVSSHQVVR